MSGPPPELTDKQIRVLEALERIKMARIAFWFSLTIFFLLLVVFVIVLFAGNSVVSTGITGLLDGLVGWIVKTVYTYLFSCPKQVSSGDK
jgi:hypothetical protein